MCFLLATLSLVIILFWERSHRKKCTFGGDLQGTDGGEVDWFDRSKVNNLV